ncbi:hypothetical protein [Furfurilactobacillus siliginis]|uniref:Uncharacterized protein n=1 Tax=Furfurilactobacillus siliginis TaxID=348151 RepID=A0A0R2L6D8_9LACO|nr:hypothetical protein [Furfurilactobacillus siliginis]KRN97122.1 hypothetical protein IV55_GL000036 [Furfurilactobacillus siliginis]GEK29600.1 hypothetical protein LSI01_19110 [Furfurilactobacillus siliginis]
MEERKLITEILNTEDVSYTISEPQNGKITLMITQLKNDKRPLATVEQEIVHELDRAELTYTESLNPDADTAMKVDVNVK